MTCNCDKRWERLEQILDKTNEFNRVTPGVSGVTHHSVLDILAAIKRVNDEAREQNAAASAGPIPPVSVWPLAPLATPSSALDLGPPSANCMKYAREWLEKEDRSGGLAITYGTKTFPAHILAELERLQEQLATANDYASEQNRLVASLRAELDTIKRQAEDATEYVLAVVNKELRAELERLRDEVDELQLEADEWSRRAETHRKPRILGPAIKYGEMIVSLPLPATFDDVQQYHFGTLGRIVIGYLTTEGFKTPEECRRMGIVLP